MFNLDDVRQSSDAAAATDVNYADDDDDDEDGFCVIPIPDCFNMDLPPSRTATTSLLVKKCSASSSVPGVCVYDIVITGVLCHCFTQFGARGVVSSSVQGVCDIVITGVLYHCFTQLTAHLC